MDGFMPHGYCLLWNPQLLWLFVFGNALVALSYYSIPASLAILVSKKAGLAFHWMFILFAAFIFACGTTHLVKIWTIWHPDYWLEALIDTATGVLSAATAILLWPLVPKALALPTTKQLEAEISKRQKAEAKFRMLLESAPDAMVVLNSEGEVVLVNAQTETLFGFSRDEIIGKKMEVMVPEFFREIVFKDRGREDPLVRSVSPTTELYARRKDGTQFPVDISLSPLETDEGTLISSAIRDITNRKQAEQLGRRLERKQANEHFIALLAHELKAPIIGANRILNAVVQKQIGDLSDQQVETLQHVLDGNTNILAMISDIVEVYTFERDLEVMPIAATNLIDLVQKSIESVVKDAQKKNITVQAQLPEALPDILANRTGLERVLQNLLENSIKFSPTESVIDVHLRANDGTVELSVQDSGSGIGAKEKERIFQRFWQGAIKGRYVPGTGQGLYYCKQIVDAHHGSISYESQPGQGTLFTVKLPLKLVAAYQGELNS